MIQDALEKQIDYQELTSLLEVDLNNIADELIQDPEDIIEFKVFFDAGEFNSLIEEGSLGEGEGFSKTPVLVKFINGDYGTLNTSNIFSTVFNIEVMGFEKDRENLRKIFETYSYLTQGLIDKDEVGIYITKTLEFPYFGDPYQLKGAVRMQGFMRLFISYVYEGQMSNEIKVFLNGIPAKIQDFEISRTRVAKSQQKNNTPEITNNYESQALTAHGTMVFDNSASAKLLFRSIKNLEQGLKSKINLTLEYPNIFESELKWEQTAAEGSPDETFYVVLPTVEGYEYGTTALLTNRYKFVDNPTPGLVDWTIDLTGKTLTFSPTGL